MATILQNFFNLEILWAALPYVLKGLAMTLLLCMAVVPLGVVGGLGVALLSTVRTPLVRWPIRMYVDFFRALPPLVLLIFLYYGMPFLGIDLPAFVAVTLGFFLNNSSYYGEIFRAGIESIPRGQTEAARSTGLTAAQERLIADAGLRERLGAAGREFCRGEFDHELMVKRIEQVYQSLTVAAG